MEFEHGTISNYCVEIYKEDLGIVLVATFPVIFKGSNLGNSDRKDPFEPQIGDEALREGGMKGVVSITWLFTVTVLALEDSLKFLPLKILPEMFHQVERKPHGTGRMELKAPRINLTRGVHVCAHYV